MRLAVTAVIGVMAITAIGHSPAGGTWHLLVEARDIRGITDAAEAVRLHTRDLMQPAMPQASMREAAVTRGAVRVKARSDAPSSSYGSQRSSSSSSKKAWSSMKKAMSSVVKTLSLGSKSKKAPSTGAESSAPPLEYSSFPSLRSSRSMGSGASRSKTQKAVMGRTKSLRGWGSSFGHPSADQRRDLTNNAEPAPMVASRPQDLRIKRDLPALLARGVEESTTRRRTPLECLSYMADRECARQKKQGVPRHPTDTPVLEEGPQDVTKMAFAHQVNWPRPEPTRPEMPVVTLGSGPKRLDLVRHDPAKGKSRSFFNFRPHHL